MNNAILLLGSNLGNRLLNLSESLSALASRGVSPLEWSHVYESDPWGFDSSNRFLNMAAKVRMSLSPEELLAVCLEVEAFLGRTRSGSGYSSRTIDIDVLLFDDLIINLPNLTVPHPRLVQRRFALVPLLQLLPQGCHPVLKTPFQQLLESCPDRSDVILHCYSNQVWSVQNLKQ
ncbi:MAG: 2-amino-4-hydroxy-6-hydroxymethyldihydropteridine diphosphokinase [Bacteroidales bacterium]|jgi:2-amino-4-hydroxy-6-hydroxymethyldihydropteridine diphosphokinase|nr:2-amino-4-hydroxy-6-hydroxymethyldihydropteridine diphosphokinase [Bacteroidales bacterium]MDD3664063.1 2-amino-4-hydroxy-6-hydroxymethyldihydropteridine diphosphokinase [Bacteroidales bacterium]